MKFVVVTATRMSESEFPTKSPLGISLTRIGHEHPLTAVVAASNTRGLPEIYNQAIYGAENDDVLAFIHDDVWIDDYFILQRLQEGLRQFDVVGVAGNRRRLPRQPAWCFLNTSLQTDAREYLSGRIACGPNPFGAVNYFGVSPARCELLDGVFLATTKSSLTKRGVQFDPQFAFDFYDMDFCRTARQKGLSLGTWPICVTHQSEGNFTRESYLMAYQMYLTKWGS